MESLSRPFHRRKLSNANNFSGKHAYDGVLSGHRPKFDGVPVVKVEEYREIFSSDSSIPVLDVSALEESSDGFGLEVGSMKPDYDKIFGGFRDEDIAVSYQELLARDKARSPFSTSPSSQDSGNSSQQSSDAMKQFNLSYNKISQRNKDGLDRTTHVTQLHAVPGFTCFIDESTSQPKKEKKKKSSVESSSKYHHETLPTGLESRPFKVSSPPAASVTDNEAASQPIKETEKQKSSIISNDHPSMNSSKQDFVEKETSQSGVESRSIYRQDESISDDRTSKTFPAELKSHPSKVSSPPAAPITNYEAASRPNNVSEKQQSSITNNIHRNVNSSNQDFLEEETSPSGVEYRSIYRQDESISDDRTSKTFPAELKSHPSKVSSPPAAFVTSNEAGSQPNKESDKQKSSVTSNVRPSVNSSKQDFLEKDSSQSGVESRSQYRQDESLSDRISKTFPAELKLHPFKVSSSTTNVDDNKDYHVKSTPTNTETCNSEEFDVNSASVALRKAIEKAEESIRIAKESVVRKKEGLRSFSSKSFKDSLKVKGRVANGKLKETLEKKGDSSHVFSNPRVAFPGFGQGEKLFGAKKVIDEINGKILESAKNSHESRENKTISDSKEVLGSSEIDKSATMASEVVENDTYEAQKKDDQRSNVFLVIESCEKNLGDTNDTIEDTIEDDKPRESKENKDESNPINLDKLSEESNHLTVYRKLEDEKERSELSDQNVHDKSFSEESGLLENNKHGFLELEHDVSELEHDEEPSEKVFDDEKDRKEEDSGEKFYDVSDPGMIENAQTYVYSLETNKVPVKDDNQMNEKEIHESQETCKSLDDNIQDPEISENSSSDYDDAEGIESLDACKVRQRDNDAEASRDVDDVSSSSSAQLTGAFYEFRVEEAEGIESEYMSEEKEIFENHSADQTTSEDIEDECETKSDDLSSCGFADVEQNEVLSESSSHTMVGMEIEVKECNEGESGTSKESEPILSNEKRDETEEFRPSKESGHISSNEKKDETQESGLSEESEPISSNEKKDETEESGPSKVVETEHRKRIEEGNAEERERERNRLAVERVIREARERAFAEARERAERAAVDRVTVEVRQRVMADAREKVSRASLGTKPSDKISISAQSKLRVERAAVERATAEARQRALEKAMSQKKISEPRVQVNEIWQTSSSDLHVSNGTSTESAQRMKAKLEKHNRIMERAAKALAEKEKRDLLAQKEQAERSRLAENLDADIKRWSNGKEGNLRALLSTLQYILGADSGWQPVSLTEIITASAVKKAYRKATLCVHPDKLQQRGASIQQKYICEKVFDLLKAAWNRFNSEER